MNKSLVALAVMLVLLVAQQPAPAQTPDYDLSAGYGYLPAGYGRLASAQMSAPLAGGPNPTTPNPATPTPMTLNGAMPSPVPMPEYQGGGGGGELFGNACAGVGWQVIGEYLYLRPTNAEVTYAQVFDNITGVSLPFGSTGVSNPFYNPGFRVSAAAALGDCAAIGLSYTYFETTVDSRVDAIDNPRADAFPVSDVHSLVLFPGAPTVADPGAFATAHEMIRFHLADVDYKAALVSGPRYCANVLIGARYASLEQDFRSSVDLDAATADLVTSNIRFEGGGLRAGLEGERQSASTGFLAYGKGTASFVAGTARGNYLQFNTTNADLLDTEFKSNRIITMLDFEVGAGWASQDGTLRVTGGYMVSAWYNTVKVARLIRSVQTVNPALLDSPTENMLAFDGLVFRVEWRF